MADAVVRLSPTNLDPHFYAYGQFPLYLAYSSTRIILSLVGRKTVDQLTFPQAIFALRFWSAVFSSATIFIGYLISKKLFWGSKSTENKISKKNLALIAPMMVAFTPGLIQTAHFGTTESTLAFSLFAVTYYSLAILENPKLKYFLLAAIILGLAFGSKISATIFLVPLILASLFQLLKSKGIKNKALIFLFSGTSLVLSLSLGILTSPYLILAYKESRGTLLYEISVAQGSPVFYTNQFLQTTPILFQLQKIFPYALGWPIFILGLVGFFTSTILVLSGLLRRNKDKEIPPVYLFIILSAFLSYFSPQAFLFAKWTRFMTPVFPFFAIFAAVFLWWIFNKIKSSSGTKILFLLLTISCVAPGTIFSSIYSRPDIRFVASEWIFNNIPSGTRVLYDTGNVVDIPILPPQSQLSKKNPGYNLDHVSFDFYHLDQDTNLLPKLIESLETSDFIFVPSRRIFLNYQRFPEKFPKTARYYQLLFSGQLGFTKVAEFKRFNDEKAEETFTVFDHPVIRIYKKTAKLTKQGYEDLFK
jgi:MFS family permease